MNTTKVQAIELRKSGHSYNEITEKLNVAKSTLSHWFKNKEWSKIAKHKNIHKNTNKSRERILSLNKARQQKLNDKYTHISREATLSFEHIKSDPVFIAAIMLYLGEGDKSLKNNLVRIGNVDPAVLVIFIKFIRQYCSEYTGKVRFWLLYYDDNNLENCENWWSEEIGVSRDKFYKAQLIKGRHKHHKLPYGVGNITISGKDLKIKILKWLKLLSEDLKRV